MAATEKFSTKYFDSIIEEKYKISDKGYFMFNGDKWVKQCVTFSEKKQLNAEVSSQQALAYLTTYLTKQTTFTCVQNYSRVQINGMCFNIQLIKDNLELSLSHSLCINISVVIPFFHLHILELKRLKSNFSKWNGFPKRKKKLESLTYKREMDDIKGFLTGKLCLSEFPDYLTHKVILPNIFTEDIPHEHFTYFNAFFQREFDTR